MDEATKLKLRTDETAFRANVPDVVGEGTILHVYDYSPGHEGRHAAAIVTVAWPASCEFSSHILTWQEDIPRWVLFAGEYFADLADAQKDVKRRAARQL